MNLLDRSFGVVVLLSLFLIACEDPSEIGLSLSPEDKVGVYVKELPVESSMVYIDSLNTSNSGLLLSGNYNDPVFGRTEATAFTQVLRNDNRLKEGAVFDSLVLYLKPIYFFGEDTSKLQRYDFHRLVPSSDTLDFSRTYFKFNSYEYQQEPLGSGEFLIKTGDSIQVVLDEAFGRELFDKVKTNSGVLDSASAFWGYFNGLAIVADAANGAVVGFDPNSGSSGLMLHYHIGEGADKDTLALAFPIINSSTVSTPYFNHIQADRSSGILPSVETYKEFSVGDKIYLQGGTGLVPKLKFDSLKHFVNATGDIIINSGELIIKNVDTSLPAINPPNGLRYYLTDESNVQQGVVEVDRETRRPRYFFRSIQRDGANPFEAQNYLISVFNKSNRDYFSYTTLFLQAVADQEGGLPFDEALIYPSDIRLNNFIVDKQDIMLRIYYTKFEE